MRKCISFPFCRQSRQLRTVGGREVRRVDQPCRGGKAKSESKVYARLEARHQPIVGHGFVPAQEGSGQGPRRVILRFRLEGAAVRLSKLLRRSDRLLCAALCHALGRSDCLGGRAIRVLMMKTGVGGWLWCVSVRAMIPATRPRNLAAAAAGPAFHRHRHRRCPFLSAAMEAGKVAMPRMRDTRLRWFRAFPAGDARTTRQAAVIDGIGVGWSVVVPQFTGVPL